jgi:hypothetical protein
MSIFDGHPGMNPLPWLQEKTLHAIKVAAHLVDLANEPDTTPWYAKELRHRAGLLIGSLAPVVALLHQAGQDAASHEQWEAVVERGSFALAAWCKKFDIANPIEREFNLLAQERDADEQEAKRAEPEAEERDEGQDERALARKLGIYSYLTLRLVHSDLTEAARRVLLWALSHLELSESADVVALSKRFLPTDVGLTPEETSEAYRLLWEQGFISRVEDRNASPETLLVRLLLGQVNESKHPLPYKEEQFGFPGARIGGRRTVGNIIMVPLPDSLGKAAARWQFSDADVISLQKMLQRDVGEDRVYIEEVRIEAVEGAAGLCVRLRHTWDEEDHAIEEALRVAAVRWVRERMVPGA